MKKCRKLCLLLSAVMLCMSASGCRTTGSPSTSTPSTQPPTPPTPPTPVSISLSGMATEFLAGEDFNCEGLTVTVFMSDSTQYVARESEYSVDYSSYDKNTAGEYTITVKLNDCNVSKTYTVTVEPKPVSWSDDGALKILTIGNSFSDDTMQYAYNIAKSLGINEVYLGNLYIGGCTIDTHYSNAINNTPAYEYRVNSNGTWNTTYNYILANAVKSADWDFISFQQASGSSGKEDTYGNLPLLVDEVKHMLPLLSNTQFVWNMTWAYQQNSTHAEFSKYNNDQTTMYQSIVNAVRNKIVTDENFAVIAPNGTAIQNARTSFVGDNLTRDGYHLTMDFGRYIAGLTFIHALTGLDIGSIAYAPENIDENYKNVAIESATNAALSPFAVTQSVYGEEPSFTSDEHTLLDYTLSQGFYNSTDRNAYATIITNNTSLSPKFFATKRFTIEELPIGSVICIKSGWQYRPEAWANDGVQATRPDNVTTRIVRVTANWWNGYKYRAFNVSKTNLAVLNDVNEAKDAMKIYIPTKSEEEILSAQGYTKYNYDIYSGFYDSTLASNYSSVITDNTSLSPKFFATKRFTKEELPVGTILVISTGWQYRPEAWLNGEVQTSRPSNNTQSVIVITEEWWGNYIYRAFNISKLQLPVISDKQDEAKTAFRIYLPVAQN